MTTRNDTWRAMAQRLGERLEHQAAACGAARSDASDILNTVGCTHDPATSHKTAKDCPFCADHAAYTKWYQKEMRALALDRVRANTTKETSA